MFIMEITYSKYGDYCLPNLLMRKSKAYSIGRCGRLSLVYLKKHRRALYANLKIQKICTSILPTLTERLGRWLIG